MCRYNMYDKAGSAHIHKIVKHAEAMIDQGIACSRIELYIDSKLDKLYKMGFFEARNREVRAAIIADLTVCIERYQIAV